MFIDFLLDGFRAHQHREAIIWRSGSYTYEWLLERVAFWQTFIRHREIAPHSVVMLQGDFSPNGIALFLALAEARCVLVPLTTAAASKREACAVIAQAELTLSLDVEDAAELGVRQGPFSTNPLYERLKQLDAPGLVLFSSGSTGASKAIVHDLVRTLDKFRVPRHPLRTLAFLLYDHMGGLNTLFYALSNGGCVITVKDRSPDSVLSAIEAHRVELLPASPTFLKLMILSEVHKKHDLSSLRTISYGTEPMTQSTLDRLHALFPDVQLLQTYGLSELGVLRSKSRSSSSLWFKVGGEGFETRVVDGILHVKAESAMLGYLNAPSPFTADGWLDTGDEVVTEGEYLRILGRTSEFINVGGEKVFPAEVESVLQLIEGVEDACVFGKPNALTGQIVAARVRLMRPEPASEFRQRMRLFCGDKLPPFKIPQDVVITSEPLHGERMKKVKSH